MTNGDSMGINETPEQIRVIRIRHFFEFDNSLILKRMDEISFYNEGTYELKQIIYHAREFLPHLCIFDSNGESLIFHGDFEDGNNSIIMGESTEEISEHSIIIEFPSHRPVAPNSFRIITLEYTNDIGLDKGEVGFIELPMGVAQHFYLHFKKLDEYITEIEPRIKKDGPDDGRYFSLKILERFNKVHIENTPSYFSISSSFPIPNSILKIGTSYKLYTWNAFWFFGGIIIGIGALLTNIVLIKSDVKTFLPAIIALGAITNTYLILTKGWLFTKALDRFVKISYKEFYITITSIYFWIIFCIFLEIFFACFLAFVVDGYNQNVDITSVNQLLSNFTLCRGWVI